MNSNITPEALKIIANHVGKTSRIYRCIVEDMAALPELVAPQPEPGGFKEVWLEYNRKTQWVQDTVQPRELGMHRADILRTRIERLEDELLAARSAGSAAGSWPVLAEIRAAADQGGATEGQCYDWWRKLAAPVVGEAVIRPEYIQEAEAHLPFGVRTGSNSARWNWIAEFLNNVVSDPARACACCNVTPDGDVHDHLPITGGNHWAAPAKARGKQP